MIQTDLLKTTAMFRWMKNKRSLWKEYRKNYTEKVEKVLRRNPD